MYDIYNLCTATAITGMHQLYTTCHSTMNLFFFFYIKLQFFSEFAVTLEKKSIKYNHDEWNYLTWFESSNGRCFKERRWKVLHDDFKIVKRNRKMTLTRRMVSPSFSNCSSIIISFNLRSFSSTLPLSVLAAASNDAAIAVNFISAARSMPKFSLWINTKID